MRREIKVIAGARQNLVKEENDQFKVYLTAPAQDGKANQALIRLLAEHFSVRPGDIEIIKGLKSRRKTINIKRISS